MRIPSDQDLARTPPGDWAPRLAAIGRHHATGVASFAGRAPETLSRAEKHRLTRHVRALRRLDLLAGRLGIRSTWSRLVNDNADRIEYVRHATKAFGFAAGRLQETKGLSESEVGNALLASALEKLMGAIPPEELVVKLAHVVATMAAAHGIDLDAAMRGPTAH